MIKLSEILTEETPIYKDWDEFVNPDHILITLKNGKKLKISPKYIKGGKKVYQAILQAFNDNNYKITNKIVGTMVNKLGEIVTEEQPHQKEMIDGIVEMLLQVKDMDNRKQMALDRLRDFKKEGIEVDADEFMNRCGLREMNEKWSAKYKRSINCSHPKGFSQRAHCQGRKKHEVIEEAMQLFLEKNCPTDPAKWSASKAAAKRKFDVYPSAYANGWAAKNYKSKGGGWKTCK